ncbi:Ubiquinone/menaquinone biosynthesis methyltransferase UbiE [Paramagnetospirillum magnetotacticum MS-1]|uniref:Ubiquinone/menaquinone biosynthesis C-methyltransferase UbiE n=1 Tax=Paramagnetospirillum magnetotacticum MS-1 TaxID=272627 RepID=A0A0C2YBY2_PARME|nr:bifunctional demethylmenaquinone methyltransferase/2-methoxy-6-polyprenyl-1,4-benzoquinol methylase UbiE [Paramagnetospirillum magnetotacticum]KIL97259.1 Ubiquinone/menaquinone biosynthesis methyltransferase UbiE [Paramagnetospirillum magnetotacticum MS-1]
MTDSHSHSDGTTHFGFKTVAEDEKVSLVRGVFDSVASKYDLMNDLMSAGVHRLWKSAFLDMLRPQPGQTLLDVGGGTGDIAFGWKKRGGGPVTVCDINREMLAVGRDRAVDRNLLDGLTWVCGNAEELPIPDRSVDRYTIAFCLRNVTHWDKAIAEAYRVLRPGGRFMCLEFSRVIVPGLREAYDAYSFNVLPKVGGMVTGNAEAYQYLVESIRKFPPQEEMAAMVEAAGFSRVEVRNLSAGIAAIHSGWRI